MFSDRMGVRTIVPYSDTRNVLDVAAFEKAGYKRLEVSTVEFVQEKFGGNLLGAFRNQEECLLFFCYSHNGMYILDYGSPGEWTKRECTPGGVSGVMLRVLLVSGETETHPFFSKEALEERREVLRRRSVECLGSLSLGARIDSLSQMLDPLSEKYASFLTTWLSHVFTSSLLEEGYSQKNLESFLPYRVTCTITGEDYIITVRDASCLNRKIRLTRHELFGTLQAECSELTATEASALGIPTT